jgi:ADP-heptose:LPS heptosyltransferase
VIPAWEPSRVERILLVKLRAIGDAVLTLPSLEALHRGFPGGEISVLCPPAAAAVYAQDPRVEELIPYDKRALGSLSAQAGFIQALQARHFDLAVCLHASFRTALLGWLSGAPWRSVRNHSGPDWFTTLPASEPKEPKSIIQRDFDALRAVGLKPVDTRPKLFIPAKAKAEAAELWKRWRMRGPALLVFPGAGKAEKQWPLPKFLAVAKALRGKRSVLFLTAPGEPSLAAEAASAGARWASVTDLKVLGALSARAGHALGNDSGPRHIAAASGAKTLTLFGPEGLREWHPYEQKDGHWAIQPPSERVADIEEEVVLTALRSWW